MTNSYVQVPSSSSGSGTVTEVDTGTGLTGGPVTTTGTIALATVTASRALVSSGSGYPAAATTTATEIGYVNGVTSAIQTQLGTKAAGAASSTDNAVARFDSTSGKVLQDSVVIVDDSGNVSGVGTHDQTGLLTITTGNNVPALRLGPGPAFIIQQFAGIKLEFVTSGAFLQFAENSDGNATILARSTKNLLLACDGTSAGKGVVVQGSSGQTALLIDVQLNDTTSIFSVAVNGNTTVNTTTGAFSPPRMTTTQRDALTAANGMVIYNSTTDALNVRAAGAWKAVTAI